ncbi:MAG: YihY family inner membrane protein [Chitinispirillaceae bacterium]|jgi:membrane protein|nr:YihY family inner membrane protein [Chitinispirillaceae bacterium]
MYLFTGKFWNDFRNDPRTAVDRLRSLKSRFWLPVVKGMVFFRIVFSELGRNHFLTRASALSFVMVITLIPLIVTSAFMLESFIEVHPKQVVQVFSRILPFAPGTILDYIGTFFGNAKRLKGWGIAGLIIVAVGLFGAVEEAFNTIWKVARARSVFVRLRTFTMVMVYTPVLIYLSFLGRHSRVLDFLPGKFFSTDILPFLFMALALMTLVWFVPHTKVRLSSAFLGGLIAGLLFECERRMFGGYVALSVETQTIYGTIAILPLFLISLLVASVIVLFGAQIAYVHQNFRPLMRAQRVWDRRVADYKTYLTFRIFLDAVSAFIRKTDPPTLRWYVDKYELTEPQAGGILNWIVHAKLVHRTGGREGYVPTRDFSHEPIGSVLSEIRGQDLRVPAIPDDYTREFMASLLSNGTSCAFSPVEQMTFEQVVYNIEESEKSRVTAAAVSPPQA